MDPGPVAVRVFFVYVILLILVRLSGKKTLGQGSARHIALGLILGDLLDDAVWSDVTLPEFATAAIALTAFEVLLSLSAASSHTASLVLDGRERVVVAGGRKLRPAMRAEMVNERQLASLLRERGIGRDRWNEVRSLWIETTGAAGLLRRSWARPADRRDRARLGKRRG